MQDISVVIPLYNKEREIERCLHSVRIQSLAPREILVIDDGCTDHSVDIVTACTDKRIRLIQQTNQGAAAARNRGIADAQYTWVAFLDADDEWKPSFLATLTTLARRLPTVALFASGCDIVDAQGESIPQSYAGLPEDPAGGLIRDFFASMWRYPPINSSNTLCRRDVFDVVGGFPVGEALAEDWDMWTRIALHYPVAYHPSVEAIYHTDAQNRAARDLTFSGQDTALLKTLRAALATEEFPYTKRDSVEQFMAKHLLEIAKHLLAAGHPSAARQRIREAWPLHGAKMKCLRWWLRSIL